MKKFFITFISTFLCFLLNAQEASTVGGKYVIVHTGNFFTNLPKQKEPPKGSVYLFDEFYKANVVFRDSTLITDYKINVNLYSKQLEILANDQVAIINYSKVDRFFITEKGQTKYFTSCSNIMIDYPEIGDCSFIEVLYSGSKVKFIDKVTLDMVPSNYNLALDAGNAYDTYYAKHEYYILRDGKVFPILLRKVSVVFALRDKKQEVKDFIYEYRLNMRDKDDVVKVVKYYNSLYEQITN